MKWRREAKLGAGWYPAQLTLFGTSFVGLLHALNPVTELATDLRKLSNDLIFTCRRGSNEDGNELNRVANAKLGRRHRPLRTTRHPTWAKPALERRRHPLCPTDPLNL